MINKRKSTIQDDYIEKYLAEKKLNLTATLDAKTAYTDADFVVTAAPTNVYAKFSVPKIRSQNDLKIHAHDLQKHTPEGHRKSDRCRLT